MEPQTESNYVLRWTIPVVDRVQYIGRGPVLLAACRLPNMIDIWTYETQMPTEPTRPVAIFGTGFEIPKSVGAHRHVCSAIDGGFVWHVFEVTE